MKIRFPAIRATFCLLAGFLFYSICFTSCKSDPKPLPLFGEWQETSFRHYDTTLSHSRHRLILDCARPFQDSLKEGDFTIFVKSLHMPSYQNEKKFVYMEYIKGTYLLDPTRQKIRLDGVFYTDSSFSVVATDSNTEFSFGSYRRSSDYRLNDLSLTLSLEDSARRDINTFYPVKLKENCF